MPAWASETSESGTQQKMVQSLYQNQVSQGGAVRLTDRRQKAKVGDVFRLSPAKGVFIWGRLMKKSNFFGLDFELNLVYIYDVTGAERPAPERLIRSNLIIGP